MCWLSMSAISTAGGRTGRLVNARLVRRRSLPHATTVATSLRRQCSVGSITSTTWPHDQPDGDFVPYRAGMDDKARRIIAELQRNGRLTNQELAEKVNLSPSPCLRRLRILEETGVIQGYAALIDQKAYGLPITVFVRIRLDRHSKDAVHAFESR